jgi:hypothetical protein
VSTRRARYLSFFCWALQKTEGERSRLHAIHELEGKLAIREAQLHETRDAEECRDIVGRTRAWDYHAERDEWSKSPATLYKNMAFNVYRPLMRKLGLMAAGSRFELTDTGKRLGKLYGSESHGRPQCLSEIGAKERVQLSTLLGLDFRANAPDNIDARRRRDTYVELERRWAEILAGDTSPGAVLTEYSQARRRPTPTVALLHRAFAWEAISLGLTTTFALLLQQARSGRTDLQRVVQSLHSARGSRASRGELAAIDLDGDDGDAAKAVVAWLRKAQQLRPEMLGLERSAVGLVRMLAVDGNENGFVHGVLARHEEKKLGDAWIGCHNGKLRVLAPKKNLDLRPGPRTYRLDAFAQLLADLRKAS